LLLRGKFVISRITQSNYRVPCFNILSRAALLHLGHRRSLIQLLRSKIMNRTARNELIVHKTRQLRKKRLKSYFNSTDNTYWTSYTKMIFAGKLSTTKHPYQYLRSTISIQTLILPKKQKISRPNSKLALLGNERRADVPFQKYQDFLLVPHGRIHHSILDIPILAVYTLRTRLLDV